MAVVVTVPERLRSRLGDATEDLVELLNQFGQSNKEDVIRLSRESFEKTLAQTELRIEEKLSGLRAEMGQLEGRLEAKIAQTEGRLDAKIAQSEGRLDARIAQSYASTVRWMFLFWIGQAAFVFGLLMVFVKR